MTDKETMVIGQPPPPCIYPSGPPILLSLLLHLSLPPPHSFRHGSWFGPLVTAKSRKEKQVRKVRSAGDARKTASGDGQLQKDPCGSERIGYFHGGFIPMFNSLLDLDSLHFGIKHSIITACLLGHTQRVQVQYTTQHSIVCTTEISERKR